MSEMKTMESEINTFIKVWIPIFASLSYCYAIGKIVPKGVKRLFFVFPIVCLLLFLPLKLSSIFFTGCTAFFISWLGNFKLLLFAFGKGPLALDPSISLGRFIVVSCLPIMIRENPQKKKHPKHQNKQKPSHKKWSPSLMKALLLTILIRVFDYKEHMHQKVVLVLYCLFVYLLLETMLAIVAASARAMLGLELEPHFNEPYLSTSLQDFWGRRWNLMVTRILHLTVYEPSLVLWAGLVGRKWARIPAVMGTFLVSGLVHELIFYYFDRVRPTWEVTWFFVLHGLCLMVEIAFKKAFSSTWRFPTVISVALTIGFVLLTSFWLFFPQLLRCEADVRLLQEYDALVGLLGSFITQRFTFFS